MKKLALVIPIVVIPICLMPIKCAHRHNQRSMPNSAKARSSSRKEPHSYLPRSPGEILKPDPDNAEANYLGLCISPPKDNAQELLICSKAVKGRIDEAGYNLLFGRLLYQHSSLKEFKISSKP